MIDKYDDLFEFYIKLYDDEIARFRELDNKISRYLSAYSILIALSGFVGLNLRFIIKGTELTLWIVGNYICLASVLLLLIPGWYHLLGALKIENLQRFAYDNSIIQFFLDNNKIDIKYALSKRAKEAIEYNVKVGNKKAEKITKAFKWSFPAMGLFVLSLLLAMFNVYDTTLVNQPKNETKYNHNQSNSNYQKNRNTTMTEQNKDNSSTSTPQQSEDQPQIDQNSESPNQNVQAPPNVHLTEGYIPSTTEIETE